MSIEELAKEFVALASKQSLTKAEQEEARQLMRHLKEAGMSNEEISKVSKGKWTPSTVKFYTPGIKPEHPSPWEGAVALLDKLVSSGLTLNDAEKAVAVSDELKSKGVSFGQVIDLLLATDSSSLQMADVIYQQELLKELGLSLKDVSEALNLKAELEKMGLKLDSLAPVVKLAKNYGEPQQIPFELGVRAPILNTSPRSVFATPGQIPDSVFTLTTSHLISL